MATAAGRDQLALRLGDSRAGAERGWFAEIIARQPKTRDRAAEFRAQGEDLTALRERFEQTARESEEILAALTADDLDATRPHERFGAVTVRWIILYVLGHYSEHLGQMLLTRQLWENRSARPHEI